jgi:hypothetical protein
MTAPEMRCDFCNWSGRPCIEHVGGRPVNVCPNCDWALGLRPIDPAEAERKRVAERIAGMGRRS